MFYSPKRKNNYDTTNNEEQYNEKENNEEQNKNKNNIKNNENYKSDNKEKIENETKSEKLEFQNQIYNLNFGYNSKNNSIFFELCPKSIESLQNFFYYKATFSYDELTKLCKSFKMCDTIQEIFSSLCIIFQNKKVFLKINENNSFNIVIFVSSVTGKEEGVNLPLERHNALEVDNNNKKENICDCKNKLEDINKKIENIEKNLRQENDELKNEIYYLKNDINKYVKTIDNNKKEIKNLKEQIKNLKNKFEEKIKNINDNKQLNNLNNINNTNDEPQESDINNKIQKDIKVSDISKKNNKININNENKKKNNKTEIIQSKSNKNQEKMKNNKKEIYKQLKEENAKKLNNLNINNNKEKSFSEFLKQKKSNIKNEKNKNQNKKLTKSYTSTGSNISTNYTKEEKNEHQYESDEEKNVINNDDNNIIEDNDDNIEDENNRYKNINEEEENEENDNINLDVKISKDTNRSQKIDQWTEDFNINVKKLLEDNDTKLRFTEKLNYMNRRIITKLEELQLIENQLLKEYPDVKDIEYNLIYRGTEDGDKVQIFHEKCKEGNNLILIKCKDEIKFGGYTKENWEGENLKKKDNNAFCFCLNKNKIYKIEEDKTAIICDQNIGPCFGDKLFQIYDNYLTEGGICFNKENCGYTGIENDYEITNGMEELNIEEMEVYKIKFKY